MKIKLCPAKIAKNISYFLVPIFVLVLITSTIGVAIIDSNITPTEDDIYIIKLANNLTANAKELTPFLIPISFISLLILAVIIINGIGKDNDSDEVTLNWFDKWGLEIVLFIGFIIGIASVLLLNITKHQTRAIVILLATISLTIAYLDAIVMLETIVKRIKAHMLLKTTVIYKIFNYIRKLIDNRKITGKLTIAYWGFCIICFSIVATTFYWRNTDELYWIILLLVIGISVFCYLFKKMVQFYNIQQALKSIYEGNTNIKLNTNEMKGVLKELAMYVEDIAGGLSNAVEQSLKSERLKTELITNVSHDIKTPLTSIINYVDLLKKEQMPNEKATEYLMILENKSQRLKKLTEDLVEASKASTGSIKLNMEKINVNELIKQVSGEFEDRFKERGLQEIISLPKEDTFINADGRYMYRILENIYSNVAKYALENTRVYLDVIKKQNSVVIQMKNISEQKLNISADELMQRFVRGETSRNTEGSGLGLSIATSLAELQGGKFQINLDGDLFKVTLGFKLLN